MENDDERTDRVSDSKRDSKFKKMNKKVDFHDMLSLTKNEINYDLDLMLCSSHDPIQFQNSETDKNDLDTLTEEQMIQYTDKSAKSLVTRVNTLNKLITRASFKNKKTVLTKESLVQSALSCLINGDNSTKSTNIFENTPNEFANKQLGKIDKDMNEFYKYQAKLLTTKQEVLVETLKELTDKLKNKEKEIEGLKEKIVERDDMIENVNEEKKMREENFNSLLQDYNSVMDNNNSNNNDNNNGNKMVEKNSSHENDSENSVFKSDMEQKDANVVGNGVKKVKNKNHFKIKHIDNNIKSLLINRKLLNFIKDMFKSDFKFKECLNNDIKFKIKEETAEKTGVINLEELDIKGLGVIKEHCIIKDKNGIIYKVRKVYVDLTEVEFYIECNREIIMKENHFLTKQEEVDLTRGNNRDKKQRIIDTTIHKIVDNMLHNAGINISDDQNYHNFNILGQTNKKESASKFGDKIVIIRTNDIKEII